MSLINLIIPSVYAQCPICVITVGGGLIIARKLGIDDLLVSIWLSALNTALAFWFASKIKNKVLNNGYLWSLGLFVITIIYLILTKQIGHINNTFIGIDKILFGLTVGLIVSVKAIWFDKFLRSRNNGKVLFPYQKVVVPLIFLLISTIFFKLLLKN